MTPTPTPQCSLDIVEGTDCPRPVVWRWFPCGRDGDRGYLCDEHAADVDLSQLEDLTGVAFLDSEAVR